MSSDNDARTASDRPQTAPKFDPGPDPAFPPPFGAALQGASWASGLRFAGMCHLPKRAPRS